MYLHLNQNIYLQYIDSSGNLRWNNGIEVHVANGNNSSYYNFDQIISDGTGGVLNISGLNNFPDSLHDAYIVKHFDQNGVSLWNSSDTIVKVLNKASLWNLNFSSPEHQIVSDGAGALIVTWTKALNSKLHIYSQRYNANRNKLWQSTGFPVTTADNILSSNGCDPPCDRMEQQAMEFGLNTAIVSWNDFRHGDDENSDLYLAKVDGILNTSLEEESAVLDKIITFPNPSKGNLFIKNINGDAEISISDSVGQEVKSIKYFNPLVPIDI